MQDKRQLDWDVKELSQALKIKEEDVADYFMDGRRISFIMERRIAYEVLNGNIAESETADYDILDKDGGKWEVRCITKYGVYFCPSYMIGSGRKFNESEFLSKLNNIEGYILSDITLFPSVKFWIISVGIVKKWWQNKKLGTATRISLKKARKLISRMDKV